MAKTQATGAQIKDGGVANIDLANMTAKTYKGRNTNSTGAPEDVSIANLKADLSFNNVDNTSDATKNTATVTLANKTFSTALVIDEMATPSNPASGKKAVYFKSDGKLYKKDSSGVETSIEPLIAIITGSNVTSIGTTLVDITGLSVALAASSRYLVECFLATLADTGTDGVMVALNLSSTAGATIKAYVSGSTTYGGSGSYLEFYFNNAQVTFNRNASAYGAITISGVINTNAAATLTVQHRKLTSGTSTILINSYLKVTKIA